MKTRQSKPEKRLGYMPVGVMLCEIRKVFPNAKIVPLYEDKKITTTVLGPASTTRIRNSHD
jgi:hypothetical protein